MLMLFLDMNVNELPSDSPVADMLKYAVKFGFIDDIKECILDSTCLKFDSMKQKVKSVIWRHEHIRWISTCRLYSNLDLYMQSITAIKMHSWWIFTKDAPHMQRQVAFVMSLLMGGQRHLTSKRCTACSTLELASTTHILFECKAIEETRQTNWGNVIDALPNGLNLSMGNMSNDRKAATMISCFDNTYTPEWPNLYKRVVGFINIMFKTHALTIESDTSLGINHDL